MAQYKKFLDFYEKNSTFLLFGQKHSIKPAKSITRNVFKSFDPFLEYYKANPKNVFTNQELIRNVWPGKDPNEQTSNKDDNIRNLVDLKFWEEKGARSNKTYHLTRAFFDFLSSGVSLKEYVLNSLSKIGDIADMTMLLNYILCVIREGLIYNKVITYPEAAKDFIKMVPNKQTRINICEKVYRLYGFKSRKNTEPGEYTPNANYRVISTCVELGLIQKVGKDQFGFNTYVLTLLAYDLLRKICKNIESNELPTSVENTTTTKIEEILEDWEYEEKVDQTKPLENLDDLDHPQVLPDIYKFQSSTKRIKRDPQKASNAKKIVNYMCEIDQNHKTFIGSNEIVYSEAHHLIPISKQKDFSYSLDIEANIVSLCPLCHRKLHHARFSEKKSLIEKLYHERIERLKKCNIDLTLDQLLGYYKK